MQTLTSDHESTTDLSAIAWVYDELRRSLDSAHKLLRRHVKETEAMLGADVDAVDPSVLRSARAQIHQGVGALELVGLTEASALLGASEASVQRYVSKPGKLNSLVVDDIEKASFALLDYLSRLLAGIPTSALSFFPQYRALLEIAGADRIHPADLWSVDWKWHQLPAEDGLTARQADAETESLLEQKMLAMMKGGSTSRVSSRMSDIFAELGAGASEAQAATLWRLAAAAFEAQGLGLLKSDVYSKRLASRLLSQLRIMARGDSDVSERLAQDILFFCAQAALPGAGQSAPRLMAVKQQWGLSNYNPVDYHRSSLGRFDPAVLTQARKRVVAAKDSWAAVAAAEMHRMSGLVEQFSLVCDSLKSLFPAGDVLSSELVQAIAQTQQSGAAPSPPLAMEVATSLLYLEACLENGEIDTEGQAARVERLAKRLSAVRKGNPPEALEPWIEDLYRRVSDRQTMGSVVHELRASLSEAEKQIDAFFRDHNKRDGLLSVPQQFSSMRGVLSVLGVDHAAAALSRMRHDVEGLASGEPSSNSAAHAGVLDRLAGNLGALGFLIDMLSVQPKLVKSLFVFDDQSGVLAPVMGRGKGDAPDAKGASPVNAEARLMEQAQSLALSVGRDDIPLADVTLELGHLSQEAHAAGQPGLAALAQEAQVALRTIGREDDESAVRESVSEALVDFVSTSSPPLVEPEPVRPAATVAAPTAATADDDEDVEMREIFLEEAQEVLETARTALHGLESAPGDLGELTTLRRAFHTLKGSSRMVGLREFGEAAWVCEQAYNTRLAEAAGDDQPLIAFTGWALGHFAEWVDDIVHRRDADRKAAPVAEAAKSFSGGSAPIKLESQSIDRRRSSALPDVDASAVSAERVQELLSTIDLSFDEPPTPSADRAVQELDPSVLDVDALPDLSFGEPPDGTAQEPVSLDPMGVDSLEFDLPVGELEFLDFAEQPAEPSQAPHSVPASPGGSDDPDWLNSDHPLMHDVFGTVATEPLPLDSKYGALPSDDLEDGESIEMIEIDLVDFSESGLAQELGPQEHADQSLSQGDASASSEHEQDHPRELQPADYSHEPEREPAADKPADDDQFKWVGSLRISLPLFNIYLNEADELSRRLITDLAEWSLELDKPISENAVALAHSLAGSSSTVGFSDLSQLARALEHAQMRSRAIGHGTDEEASLFGAVADEIRRLLHQFAAGFLKEVDPDLMRRLAEHELTSAKRLEDAAAEQDRSPDADSELESLRDPMDAAQGAQEEDEPSWASMPNVAQVEALGQAELKPLESLTVDPQRGTVAQAVIRDEDEEDIDAVDAVDLDLFPIFEEEALELLPQLASQIRAWVTESSDKSLGSACMRTLHTLKGGARLAGAMRLGELAHRLETRIEHVMEIDAPSASDIEALEARVDALNHHFEVLCSRDTELYESAVAKAADADVAPLASAPSAKLSELAPAQAPSEVRPAAGEFKQRKVEGSDRSPGTGESSVPTSDPSEAPAQGSGGDASSLAEVDWSRFTNSSAVTRQKKTSSSTGSQASVRVNAPLLDRLVNEAGEVSIRRSRIESVVLQMRNSLTDLTDNLERLRVQLRDIELQGETQMSSRLEAAKAADQSFDPLEFDRFTRFQELTRMMAESVNDVATVQRALQRTVQGAEDELAAQARLTRSIQDDLLRTRMVEFEGLSDRLYRVVRQAAKEMGKQVRLDIVGGSIEVDRGVLDRMIGSFEHLLRNSVTHGVEPPEIREKAGKDPAGSIIVSLVQEGNEVAIEFRDDGAGLDLQRIRAKGLAQGLLTQESKPTDAELANLIFMPGFSTADKITELAGRGVGMDVVRSEVNAMGGRIETATSLGQGTSFKLVLPLTTAVTQVVMMRCGGFTVAVPSNLIEIVQRCSTADIEKAYASGTYPVGDRAVAFFWLGSLLQVSPRSLEPAGRMSLVVVVRSAQQRVAIHVDEVLGNQEVVVKNLGPQLSRMPGLAGVTLLASGGVALIYNPVALATLYGESAQAATFAAMRGREPALVVHAEPQYAAPVAPLVLVVDDSLTVRRVTQRLLVREGYRVVLAKDGLEALEVLSDEKPRVVLSDIEMPRMDGFDLLRNIRSDDRLRDLPVIMITSRIAQKHRDYAMELGVDHYLGKPYSEEELLSLVGRYTAVNVQ